MNTLQAAPRRSAWRAPQMIYLTIQLLAATLGAWASFGFGWRIGGWVMALGLAAMGAVMAGVLAGTLAEPVMRALQRLRQRTAQH